MNQRRFIIYLAVSWLSSTDFFEQDLESTTFDCFLLEDCLALAFHSPHAIISRC